MPHRRSVRLPGHDYAGGLYFITFCTHERQPLLGTVEAEAVRLSPFGRIAHAEWERTAALRAEVVLDAFVVMPNHVHALVGIIPESTSVGAHGRAPLRRNDETGKPLRTPRSLGALVAGYKSSVTAQINRQRGTPGAPVWQRGYHERVVRDDREAEAFRRYIAENPLRWHLDRYHPDRARFR